MKTNKKKKAIESFLVVGILTIMFCSLVSAFGVVSPYSGSDMPLNMFPGEEKTFSLTLQNWDNEEGVSVEGTILEGMEIASLKGDAVNLPYQQKIVTEMTVKIPIEASIGDKYNIKYEFKELGEGSGGGMVAFTQILTREFEVNVVQKPEEKPEEISTGWIVLAIVLIVIVIAVIWFIVKNRKSASGVKGAGEEEKPEKPVK